jgi:AcrR family transcriptional regulator
VLDAAMHLFGSQGFRGTTIAQIEEAAGLTPGAGGLYRHFASKRQLLEAGIDHQIQHAAELQSFLDPAELSDARPAADRFASVARASLGRLEAERDVNRLLLRDLADFPELLARVRDNELRRVHGAFAAWLGTQSTDASVDLDALAAVLMSAVSHYWIMRDVFGEYPLAVDEKRFVNSLAEVAVRMIRPI